MFEEKGDWLRLYRKVLESRVWSDPVVFRVWAWCLLKANWKPAWFMGQEIPAGSFVFGRFEAAEELKMHHSSVYRAIKKLESWDQISVKSNNKFSIVSVCNWGAYQTSNFHSEQQTNNKRTTSEQQANTIEEGKESKESKERKKRERVSFAPPTPQEVVDYGRSIDFEINGERFCAYYEQAGWKLANGNPMKNWKAAVVTWKNREEDKKPKPFKQRPATDEELAAWKP